MEGEKVAGTRVRKALAVAFACTLGTSVVFIVAILVGAETGVELHETAAAVLCILLTVSLVLSLRLRSADSRPVLRVVVAFVALGVAAVLGGSLALGWLPSRFSGLPLAPLLVLIGATADGLRLAWPTSGEG